MTKVALSLLGLALLWPAAASAACTLPGSGTDSLPYLVGSYSDLKLVDSCDGLATYRITANIDASASQNENGGAGFVAIGTANSGFYGSIHGGGHVINHLFINDAVNTDVGLIGNFQGGVLDSLGLVGASIVSTFTNGESNIGGLAGSNGSSIRNCYLSGGIVSGKFNSAIGGFVGNNSGSINDSYFTQGQVTGGLSSKVGGFIGDNSGYLTSTSATNNKVVGNQGGFVGGLIGTNSSSIALCYATGHTTGGNASHTGGLVGDNSGSISTSYAADTVSGGLNSIVGGLVGSSIQGFNSIQNTYATGLVSGGDSSLVGGIVGELADQLGVSYAVDSVWGAPGSVVGGVVGQVDTYANIGFVYWNPQTSGLNVLGLGRNTTTDSTGIPVGLTKVQLQDTTKLKGFAFTLTDDWMILPGSYPLLRGLPNASSVGGAGILVRHSSVAKPMLRLVGSKINLSLPLSAIIRVVDVAGRSIVPQTELAAGNHELNVPRSNSMLFVLVKSGATTTTLPLEPLH